MFWQLVSQGAFKLLNTSIDRRKMEPSYRDQITLAEYLLNKLETRLAGREEVELLDRLPNDKYHLGVLGPWKSTMESFQPEPTIDSADLMKETSNPSSNVTKSSNAKIENSDEGSSSEIENEESGRITREDILRKRGVPSAIGMEFVVEDQKILRLEFDVEFSFYTRRFPTWEQQFLKIQGENDGELASGQKNVSLGDRHIRHDIKLDKISIELSSKKAPPRIETILAEAISKELEIEKKQPDVWRKISRMSIPVRVCKTKEEYQKYLANLTQEIDLPPLKVVLDIRLDSLPNKTLRVGVYLVNKSLADEESMTANATRYIFDAKIRCSINGKLRPIEMIGSPQNYQYDPDVWAIGQGCSVDANRKTDSCTIETRSLAHYYQPRLVTKDEIKVSFKDLQDDPVSLLYTIRKSMQQYIDEWEEKLQKDLISLRNQAEKDACIKDLTAFKDEVLRFSQGINALENDVRLLQAFKSMHHVFERVGAKKQIISWRLFQIGFIVTQLPALAVREGKINTDALEYLDVLWFPTGGGKTEAYLGLISCAILYDRLRGKNVGITAWLRFPLRMLSVQQLQRAVKVLHETERERQKLIPKDANGSQPVSLGYFVGKSSTPNQLSNEKWAGKWKLSELETRREVRDQLRLVRDCPECGLPKVEIVVDAKKFRIKHVCASCGTDLNIYVSDDEVYRYLPSLLIGTVDKLPSVAWQKNFSFLWNGADLYCPEHGYSSGKYCIVFGCKENRIPVQLYDSTPSLQIQDELHLLREELGTFAGHYETLAEVCQKRNGLPPKVMAATATVEGLDRQSMHLYNLRARRFPARGYKLNESFYTTLAMDDSVNPKTARIYVAFRPPTRHPPDASADVLEIFHSEIRKLYGMIETDDIQSIVQTLRLNDATTKELILELLDKYDTTLTYVGSKSHGSRIERVLADEKSKIIPKAGDRQIEVSYLNGESTLDDIAGTIESLETASEWDSAARLDAVIGTSLISHGVDVSRFNLMIMSGMPGRTAEYIQSSSRSSRQFAGIVVVVLSSWLLRDQSLYHRFNSYHYHMDHMVEPVPINRFSKFAVDKTLPGILAGLLNAYLGPKHKIDLTKVTDLQKALYNNTVFSEEELLQRVKDAYGLNNSIHSSSLNLALSERLNNRFKVEMRRLRTPSSVERVTDALSNKPMTSLRDVDEPVPFEPKENTYLMLRWLDR